jgi:hypothetical protein
LAGLILAARLVFNATRRALYAPSEDERLLMIGSVGSLTAILVHSFADFNLYIPVNGAIFAWICGIAAAGVFSPSRSEPRRQVSI